MARKIIGVIVGYISMAIVVFAGFTLLYLILGTEGAFQPGSYAVSIVWIILSLIISFFAAILGGYICTIIAKHKSAAFWLAAIVFILGIILAVPEFGSSGEVMIREGDVPNMEAMQNAKQPLIVLILNPIIGALGVMLGAKLWKNQEDVQEV